jgi:predicted RNA-binding Zn-ribbon protein involved in translation (DUF1610 family)
MAKSIFAALREERSKMLNEENGVTGTEVPKKEEKPVEEEVKCPECGSLNVKEKNHEEGIYECDDCGKVWVNKVTEEDKPEDKKEEVPVKEEDDKPVEDKPEDKKEEKPVDEEGDVIQATFCPVHGLVSGVGDAQVTSCPICGETALEVKNVKVVGDVDESVVSHKFRVPLTEAQKRAIRKARSLKRSHLHEEDDDGDADVKVTCPECGYEGPESEFDEKDGRMTCPECGYEGPESEFGDDEDDTGVEESVSTGKLRLMLESVGAPKEMFTALRSGKKNIVKRYIKKACGGK